jgi:hypothetical protein
MFCNTEYFCDANIGRSRAGTISASGYSLHFCDIRIMSVLFLIATKLRTGMNWVEGQSRHFALRKSSEPFRRRPTVKPVTDEPSGP